MLWRESFSPPPLESWVDVPHGGPSTRVFYINVVLKASCLECNDPASHCSHHPLMFAVRDIKPIEREGESLRGSGAKYKPANSLIPAAPDHSHPPSSAAGFRYKAGAFLTTQHAGLSASIHPRLISYHSPSWELTVQSLRLHRCHPGVISHVLHHPQASPLTPGETT